MKNVRLDMKCASRSSSKDESGGMELSFSANGRALHGAVG
jgi:hypothetical protein